MKYSKFLLFSKKHYGIKRKDSFLKHIVLYNTVNSGVDISDDNIMQCVENTLNEMCDMFTMICHENIKFNYDDSLGYCFCNMKNDILISDKNFNHIRKIILQQNLLREPKVYKDKLVQEWEEKAIRAKSRLNKSLDIYEIKNILRCELKMSYEEIENMNIFQFKMDFRRICNNRDALALDMLKVKFGVNPKDLPRISYQDSILEQLLQDPSKDAWIDEEKSNIYKAMNG